MTCLLMPVDAPQYIDDFSSTTPVIVMTYVVSVVTHMEECDLFFFWKILQIETIESLNCKWSAVA